MLNGMALKLKTLTVYDISLPDDHWKNMPMVSFDFLQMGFVILVKQSLTTRGLTRLKVHITGYKLCARTVFS